MVGEFELGLEHEHEHELLLLLVLAFDFGLDPALDLGLDRRNVVVSKERTCRNNADIEADDAGEK